MARSTRSVGDSWDLASSVGATATMVAAARAVASREPDRLIDDPYAAPLVRAVGIDFFTKVVDGQITLDDGDHCGTAADSTTPRALHGAPKACSSICRPTHGQVVRQHHRAQCARQPTGHRVPPRCRREHRRAHPRAARAMGRPRLRRRYRRPVLRRGAHAGGRLSARTRLAGQRENQTRGVRRLRTALRDHRRAGATA